MSRTETIRASMQDFDMQELEEIREAVDAELRRKALESLRQVEEEANRLRSIVGVRAKPVTRANAAGTRRNSTRAMPSAGPSSASSAAKSDEKAEGQSAEKPAAKAAPKKAPAKGSAKTAAKKDAATTPPDTDPEAEKAFH